MTPPVVYPTRAEGLQHHECHPPTPYALGFEHYRYLRIYCPPYHIGSAEWEQYNAGNRDARRAEREESI